MAKKPRRDDDRRDDRRKDDRHTEEQEPPAEIAIVGELFEETEQDVIQSLLDVDFDGEVTLYIDSGGGSVYTAMAVATLIRYRRLKATAVVIGECSSSALLVFAACQKRLVTPRSTFLFHRVKWRSEKDTTSYEAVNWAAHFQWLETELDRYQASLFKLEPAVFDEWTREARFVLGADLVKLGLAEMVDV
ncbi:MAG: ATP-dependent Clp protease proteolytic subunit [Planctomycetia bacterium]